MDGAGARDLYSAAAAECVRARQAAVSRRVAAVAWTGRGEGLPGAAVGADLGGSSKYSSENLED